MPYYFYHPLKPQYFFPINYKDYPFLTSFYQPYTLWGSLSWIIWNKFIWLRKFSELKDIEKYIPEKLIRKYIGYDAIIAFNRGTMGPEQKITALVDKETDRYFLKFGQTQTTVDLIKNEADILHKLSGFQSAPSLLGMWETKDYILIKTDLLEGKRFGQTVLSDKLTDFLIMLSDFKIDAYINYEGALKTGFSHGDFCPWNLMICNDIIKPYDWEMAGYYPLGYDIFTFVFQTNFLLFPQKTNEQILQANYEALEKFFQSKEITDWKPYLNAFAMLKVKNFQNTTSKLFKRYKILTLES